MPPITSTPALPAETGGHHQRAEQWQGQKEKENAETPSLCGKQVRVRACVGRGEYGGNGVSPLATRDGIGEVTDTLARVVASQSQADSRRLEEESSLKSVQFPASPMLRIASLSRKCNERYVQAACCLLRFAAGWCMKPSRGSLSLPLGAAESMKWAPLIPCDCCDEIRPFGNRRGRASPGHACGRVHYIQRHVELG